MTATRNDIESWFKYGKAEGLEYLIVMCDSYDYDNYPKYCSRNQLQGTIDAYPKDMQYIEEIYDLNMDMTAQVAQYRCFSLPPGVTKRR